MRVIETILSAAISGAVTLIVCLLTNHAQSKRTLELLDYRLGQLEQKVSKHNHLVERTYHLEGDMDLVREQIKVANHRISDLEHKN